MFYTYKATRNTRVFITFIAVIGFGYLIEAIIYNFMHSYQYFPKIIKDNPVYDSDLGAIASNALSLPSAATYLGTLQKKWPWSIFFTALFAGIEWLFLKLDIYRHKWWRIEFTSLGLVLIYFPIAKRLHQLIMQPLHGWRNVLILYLIISPILGSFHIMPILVFNNRYYDAGFFNNISEDTNAFAALYYIISSLIVVLFASWKWKWNWSKYLFLSLIVSIVTVVLRVTGILHSLVWWDVYYYLALPNLVLLVAIFLSKNLMKGPMKSNV